MPMSAMPAWIRGATWAVGTAVIGPVVVTAAILAFVILRAVFP
jgi:hypothetical protein